MKLQEVKPQEDFIVQVNGEYNIVFDEVAAEADCVAGEVVTVGDAVGIASKASATGELVRVMVRGNPSTVNAQALTGLTPENTATLAAQGILVVNA